MALGGDTFGRDKIEDYTNYCADLRFRFFFFGRW